MENGTARPGHCLLSNCFTDLARLDRLPSDEVQRVQKHGTGEFGDRMIGGLHLVHLALAFPIFSALLLPQQLID